MGHSTDFVGHIDIHPPLNAEETAYLDAFRLTRHSDHGGSPYDVPGNPLAPSTLTVEQDSRLGAGKPQLWCHWQVCPQGDCLAYDGLEKCYAPVEWLRYLVDHLLRPGATASAVDHPQLAAFTFDHHLDGIVVGCRRDTRELFAIEVQDNQVSTRVLRRGDPQPWDEPPLAYESVIDRDREWRTRRRADSPAARAQAGTVRRQRPRLV